jgi:hypothetical protein
MEMEMSFHSESLVREISTKALQNNPWWMWQPAWRTPGKYCLPTLLNSFSPTRAL